MQANISLSFPVIRSDGPSGFAYVYNFDGLSCYSRSMETAKKALRTALRNKIVDMAAQDANHEQTLIACNDGTMLVVQFRNGSWGYNIARSSRGYASSTWGHGDFAKAVQSAVCHANDSYDGVAWQCRI